MHPGGAAHALLFSLREKLARQSEASATLTLAKFGIGSALNLAEIAHYPIEPYAEIKRWYAGLRALPAWQKTLAQCALPVAATA
jgi:glutathione S-transferase